MNYLKFSKTHSMNDLVKAKYDLPLDTEHKKFSNNLKIYFSFPLIYEIKPRHTFSKNVIICIFNE